MTSITERTRGGIRLSAESTAAALRCPAVHGRAFAVTVVLPMFWKVGPFAVCEDCMPEVHEMLDILCRNDPRLTVFYVAWA